MPTPSRLLLILVTVILVIIAVGAWELLRTSPPPLCVGLKCYEDRDCGKGCSCDLDPGEKLGTCVAK